MGSTNVSLSVIKRSLISVFLPSMELSITADTEEDGIKIASVLPMIVLLDWVVDLDNAISFFLIV